MCKIQRDSWVFGALMIKLWPEFGASVFPVNERLAYTQPRRPLLTDARL